MFERDLIAVFIDFIMGAKSPINLVKKRVKMGIHYRNPDFGALVSAIGFMVEHSSASQKKPAEGVKVFELSENSNECLNSIAFYC